MKFVNALKRTSDDLGPVQSTPPKRRKIFTQFVSVGISPSDVLVAQTSATAPEDGTIAYRRDPIYYFDDGDIIVQAETTLFRVHAGNLVKLGGIFEELLSLPQPTGTDDAGYIDGVPVCPLFGTAPRDVRYLMAYAYGKISPKITTAQIFDSLHWNSAVSLLHLSHMFDLVDVRREVIDAFEVVFPCKLGLTIAFPALAGIKKQDRGLFARVYPLQAINLFQRYSLHAFMPMAYYRAAQLDITDIVSGVICSDGSRTTIRATDVIKVLQGRELLRRSRRNVLLCYFNDLVKNNDSNEPEPPSLECLDIPSRSTGLTCAQYVVKLALDFNSSGYLDTKTDALSILPPKAHDIFKSNFCSFCFKGAVNQMASGLGRNWDKLPSYFGLKDWEKVLEAQKLEDKRYED
ncbi:hypothetical protein D9615_002356 [Tricholomella constricta]|uniref:BTB domain-containing protein n=1 Tax=Tricholomella constricta TaxID=117010 RepID=A0A8H5HM91_9AGAR|nr:hypothetical protein D9615_002356 [Tricholomella constricta]